MGTEDTKYAVWLKLLKFSSNSEGNRGLQDLFALERMQMYKKIAR